MGQRFPLLLLDDSDEDSDSGETISSSSPSSSPASSSSPVSPSFSLSSTSSVSPVSPRSPVVPASPILDKPLPALPIELSTPSSPRINGNKVSPLAGRRISAGDNSNTLAGPRYVPSSKTAPRPRVAAQRPTLQQTLPFLRTSTTFDDILALKTSSSFNSTPLTFDEILGSSTRPEPKLIHRKPVPVFSPKVEKPAEPTASKQIITRHASQIIRPYDQTRLQSKRRAQRVVPLSVLAPSSSSANTTSPQVNRLVPYNSHHGYSLLQTLRRLLIIPTDWSPTQTLLFILQHPAVRHLALPFHLSSSPQSDYFQDLLGIPRCNALDWYGILQAIDGPIRYHAARKRSQQSLKLRAVPPTLAPCSNPRALSTNTPFSSAERDLVARWLAGGEPLFTGRMTLPAVLLRKSGKPLMSTGRTQQQSRARTPLSPLASSSVRTNDDQAASSLPPLDPATRYDISRNPRCRYHQLWTGAGKSRLSVTMLAEIEV
ncbi:hypothetical protein Sste5346_007261 [Sporothrix stenoceras]|uniref:Uncharacterized protein n=1 Tax=Sporothrix stenoceras TaxID=5173 RepID=A0ABR3YW33_9PEZI